MLLRENPLLDDYIHFAVLPRFGGGFFYVAGQKIACKEAVISYTRYYFLISLERLEKIMKHLSQDRMCPFQGAASLLVDCLLLVHSVLQREKMGAEITL
jgi:hypothetical protein